MSGETTKQSRLNWLRSSSRRGAKPTMSFVLAWSAHEPERLGEVARVHGPAILGRGGPRPEDTHERLAFVRERPSGTMPCPPIGERGISREQLRVEPSDGNALSLTSVGAASMKVNGRRCEQAVVHDGDVVELEHCLVMLVSHRQPMMPASEKLPAPLIPEFGGADAFGMVGETPERWALRQQLAFIGPRKGHALVLGPSGSGKELVAQALHGLSDRQHRSLVARNAATLPEGILDAELFGNLKDYPNPGTPERRGLIGEADRSSLFLDEIGEISAQLQSHLLRVLDAGEYQRLGETRTRQSDLRLIAATNRPLDELKHDLVPRLVHRIRTPPLTELSADIPLVVRHLVRTAAKQDEALGRLYLEGDVRSGHPRIDPALITALLRHQYSHHVRELFAMLWVSMGESTADRFLRLTPGVEQRLSIVSTSHNATDPEELDRATLLACLERNGWKYSAVWRELGLSSRHVLYRLMRKHALKPPE